MVDGGGEAEFTVVFFDGEEEMNVGTVQINPDLEYKPFQLILSEKIGVSPNQMSIYLVDKRKDAALPFTKGNRRMTITGKVNFGLICGVKDCYFLVLKRSRKSRNRRERSAALGVQICSFIPGNEFTSPPVNPGTENLILLRRNQPAPFYDCITQMKHAEFNVRLLNLRFERENRQSAKAEGQASPFPIGNPYLDYFLASDNFCGAKSDSRTLLCTECVSEEKIGDKASFHACIRDAVVTCFQTRMGPINRPNKRS